MSEQSDQSDEDYVELCMKCHAAPITYRANTCGHGLFCGKCAMKCATGGKCKVCGQLYSGVERLR